MSRSISDNNMPTDAPNVDETNHTSAASPAEFPATSYDSNSLDEAPTGGMAEPSEEQRRVLRDNARRVLRESGAAEILQTLNKHALQGRGRFEEYDSGVVFKWGTGVTTRHIWVHVSGEQLRFRLRPHLKCAAPVPACDGEYHTFTPQTWRIPNAVLREVDRNYKRPVAEASSD